MHIAEQLRNHRDRKQPMLLGRLSECGGFIGQRLEPDLPPRRFPEVAGSPCDRFSQSAARHIEKHLGATAALK